MSDRPVILAFLDANQGAPDDMPLHPSVTIGHVRELWRAFDAMEHERDDLKATVAMRGALTDLLASAHSADDVRLLVAGMGGTVTRAPETHERLDRYAAAHERARLLLRADDPGAALLAEVEQLRNDAIGARASEAAWRTARDEWKAALERAEGRVRALVAAAEDARAALADNALSRQHGGRGIVDNYYRAVDAKLRADLGGAVEPELEALQSTRLALDAARAKFHGLAVALAVEAEGGGYVDRAKLLASLREGAHEAAAALPAFGTLEHLAIVAERLPPCVGIGRADAPACCEHGDCGRCRIYDAAPPTPEPPPLDVEPCPQPVCDGCGKPATCGIPQDEDGPDGYREFDCDECCDHTSRPRGNCRPLADAGAEQGAGVCIHCLAAEPRPYLGRGYCACVCHEEQAAGGGEKS